MPVIELRAGEQVRYQAKAKTPLARSGRACIDVTLSVNGKSREVVPVFFEMASLQQPMRSRDEGAVRRSDQCRIHAPISSGRDFLVKTGDNVKLIANIGSARLEALGEAQQNGRLGDVIRVRNVESNRIVHGRVEASGAVLVEY